MSYHSRREGTIAHHCSDFLKERLFGLSNPEGNHGESIKEAHFHVDNVPTVGSAVVAILLLLTVFPAFVHEVPVQVSSEGVPVQRSRRN